jgi:transposase
MSEAPGLANPGSSRAPNIESVGDDVVGKSSNALDPEGGSAVDFPGPMAGRRRRFTNDEKRRFLDEASASGESMSSVGRRYGLSVSLLFRWRRQLDGLARPNPRATEDGARAEARELRDKVKELERLLGRKTLEAELLKQELVKLGENPSVALNALDGEVKGNL